MYKKNLHVPLKEQNPKQLIPVLHQLEVMTSEESIITHGSSPLGIYGFGIGLIPMSQPQVILKPTLHLYRTCAHLHFTPL